TPVPEDARCAYSEQVRSLSIVLAALALAAGAAACGGSKSSTKGVRSVAAARPSTSGPAPASATGNPSPGAKVFADAGCGGCHTLAAAASTGNVGPDLDQLKPDKATVVRQVTYGGRGMPAFGKQLTKEQIDAVAEFVSQSAAKSPRSVAAQFK